MVVKCARWFTSALRSKALMLIRFSPPSPWAWLTHMVGTHWSHQSCNFSALPLKCAAAVNHPPKTPLGSLGQVPYPLHILKHRAGWLTPAIEATIPQASHCLGQAELWCPLWVYAGQEELLQGRCTPAMPPALGSVLDKAPDVSPRLVPGSHPRLTPLVSWSCSRATHCTSSPPET